MKPFTDILNATLAKFTTDLIFVGMSSVSLKEYANVKTNIKWQSLSPSIINFPLLRDDRTRAFPF